MTEIQDLEASYIQHLISEYTGKIFLLSELLVLGEFKAIIEGIDGKD